MPGEQDKQVKLSFVVDQSSVQKAKQAMNDLISTAQRLAETLQRANIGGIGGGGSGGMGTGTVSAGGGASGSQSPGRVLTTVAAQNPGNRVASALSDNVRAIMSMAKAGGDAAKTLSETLKRSIADQERSIDGLQRKLTGLMDTFGKLSSTKMAAPGMEPHGEFASEISELHRRRADRLSRNIEDTAGELDTAHKGLEGLKDARKTLVDPKAPSGTGGGEGGAAAGGGGSFTDSVLKGALSLGAIKMALNVGGQVTNMMGSGGEVWRSNLMAAQGKTWGSMYQGARAGDISTGYKAMFLGGGLQGDGTSQYNKVLQGIKGAKTTDQWNTMLGDMSGVLGMDITKFRDAAFNEQRSEALRGQAMKAVQENWEQSSGMPMLMNIQRFQGNVGTQMGLERQLGYGGRVVKNVNGKLMPSNFDELKEYTRTPDSPKWGGTEVAYYDPIHAKAQALAQKNVLIEEQASATEQARTSGALSAIGRITGAMGAGGAWGGAGGLAGQAAIGGASGSFLGGVMGMGGNAAAAMGMGGLAAAGLGGAGVQTSGLGLLAAMQQGFSKTGGEGDMWNVREAQGGLQLMGGLLGGGIDQYQKAVNFANAGSSFGGGDMSRQQYLADVFGKDPNLMADVLSGNPNDATKAWMEAHGVTKEGAQNFMTQSSASLIGRAAAQETGSDPGQRAILAIQNEAGGDIGKYMQMHDIKKGTKEARKLANLVGAGGAESGISDDAGWAGFLKTETGFGGTLKQGGVGAVKSASRDEALRQQAQQGKQDQDIDTKMGLIKTAADAIQPAVVAFGGAVTQVEANAEHLADALEWLARRVLKAGGSSDDTIDEFIEKSDKKRADAKASAHVIPNLPSTPTKHNGKNLPGKMQ